MTPEGWTTVEMQYNKRTKTVLINARSADFVPAYLKYLLEYKGIPSDVKIVFLRDTEEVKK